MSWTLIAYWVCFLTGTTYALISGLLSGLFGFGHGGVEAGHSFEVTHDYGTAADASAGHGEAFSVEAQAEAPIAPLSPATISVFLATFGGVGIILTSLFDLGLLVTLPASAGAAFLVAAVVFTFFYRLFMSVQASSEPRMAEAVGAKGEVTVPIPADGVGEIAFVVRGSRLTAPARSQQGVDLPRYAPVRVLRQVGSTFYVQALTEEESGAGQPPGEPDFHD